MIDFHSAIEDDSPSSSSLTRLLCFPMHPLLLVLPVPSCIIGVFNILEKISTHRAMLGYVNLG
jgi:hypothetical protein